MQVMPILSALIVALCLVAPAPAAEKTHDDEIFDNVRLKLAGDPDVRGTAFEVTVKEGEVTLRGQVDKEKNKKRAEKLAKKVKGVKRVVNELTVVPR